jgi:hypothetical protein
LEVGSALEKFLEAAGEYRKEGKGYLTRCPAHEDENPSLHIEENARGDVLLVCRSQNCSFEDICKAYGLAPKDARANGSHEGRPAASERGQGRPPFNHRDITHVYEYVDEQNRPLFQVVRDRNKNFLQRRIKPGHRDPGEEPVYEYNLEGVRRVLYRLPEVVAARRVRHRIYVVEGEKDADNLAELGLIATTAPQGAAAKWLPQYTDQLAGAFEVIIIPDNDEPGRKHALEIRDAIAEWVTTTRVLELPSLPDKGDVSDWIASGGTRDALERLADETPKFITPAQRFTAIDVSLSEFMSRNYPKPRSFLANGLISSGDLVFFYGRPGLGKTWFILQLVQQWAKGEGIFGLAGPEGGPLRVGVMELELNAHFFQNRILSIQAGNVDEFGDRIRIVSRPDLAGAVDIMADDWPAWSRWVRDRDLDVVIVDALSRAHSVDENKAVEFGPVLRRLDELRFDTKAAVLAIHHEPKQSGAKGEERDDMDALRGTTRMQSDSNALIRLVQVRKDELFALKFPKTNNAAPIAPIYLERPKSGGFHVSEFRPEEAARAKKEANVDKVREALFKAGSRGLTEREIAGIVRLSEKTVGRHLEVLGALKAGDPVPQGDGKGKKWVFKWRLPDTDGHRVPCPSDGSEGSPLELDV